MTTIGALTENSGESGALRGRAARRFFQNLPFPAVHIDRARGLYMVNAALAKTFGYKSTAVVEDVFQKCLFFSTHFSPEAIARFYGAAQNGTIRNLLIEGRTLDGHEIALEINADIRLADAEWRMEYADAFFTNPIDIHNVEILLEKARHEAELAVKAKNEFLSNISHELRTPLNIIIGMLNMAAEDEGVSDEVRENLSLARDAADGLFSQVNDLIILSSLEARRLTSESTQFTPELLVKSLMRKFAGAAAEKNISLAAELDEFKDGIFESGYNLLHLALEKLVHNAIKFNRGGGHVRIQAGVILRDGGPWLHCEISDDGPGLSEQFLDGSEELFRQGDTSMSRQHGGLGLGLRLTGALIRHLNGDMQLENGENGGANPKFNVPIRFSTVEFTGNDGEGA